MGRKIFLPPKDIQPKKISSSNKLDGDHYKKILRKAWPFYFTFWELCLIAIIIFLIIFNFAI